LRSKNLPLGIGVKKEISKEERDGNCESVFVMKRKIKILKKPLKSICL
jgi:hypothetical protein